MKIFLRFEEDCRIGQQVRFLSYIDSDNHEAFRLLDRMVFLFLNILIH